MGDLKTAGRNNVDELFIGPVGLSADHSLEISDKSLISLKTYAARNRDGVFGP